MTTETNEERLGRLKADNENLRKFLGDLVDKFPQILDMEWVVERAELAWELEKKLNGDGLLTLEEQLDHAKEEIQRLQGLFLEANK